MQLKIDADKYNSKFYIADKNLDDFRHINPKSIEISINNNFEIIKNLFLQYDPSIITFNYIDISIRST